MLTEEFDIIIVMWGIIMLMLMIWAEVGLGYDWTGVEDTVSRYLFNGAFKGGILRVSNGSQTLLNLPFGHLSQSALPFGSPAVENGTIFDMASVTKVTATLSCIMRLYEEGALAVDDPVTKFIPEYGNHGKESTTLRNLLLHNAGLPPDYPGALPGSKAEVMQWVFNCTLDYPLGSKFVYSDLSFILLGEIAERLSGLPLEVYARQQMHRIGMANTSFLPDPALLPRIAPTEYSGTSTLS
jgi:CubicO group peptidase (beta-lactamase class C family)